MNYLLDTCLISELIKNKPETKVVDWLEKQSESSLYLSVITLGEIQKGISRLVELNRKNTLIHWLKKDLTERFEGRILNITTEIALKWGNLQGEKLKKGITLPVIDTLLAATAFVHNLTLVTRNTNDLKSTNIPLFDPWTMSG